MKITHDLRAVAAQFQIPGDFEKAERHGTGHINDTYRVVFRQREARTRYVIQRINHQVFTRPVAVMENIERVTAHLAGRIGDHPDASRRVLTLVRARDGRGWINDPEGNYWRTCLHIENARTVDVADASSQALEAARAFGRFQAFLVDLPGPRLHETIPGFHHTVSRFAAFEKVLDADTSNRAVLARPEIEFVLARRSLAGALLEAGLPERVIHNDTKLNNVLLDDATGEGICVVDLDTVMPGLAPYDFGDMVRTATSIAAEDERDLSKVEMRFSMFEALARGYLETAGGILTPGEKRVLPLSGKLITFEVGLRFLTDFLQGDTYFKVHRDGHNLDRCRTQFKLVESIEKQEEEMNRLVAALG